MLKIGEPTYLGDGLYAVFDGWQVELYAWDGMVKTNRVYLEPVVLEAFLGWVARVQKMVAEARAVPEGGGDAAGDH